MLYGQSARIINHSGYVAKGVYMEYHTVRLYLKQGSIFIGKYEAEEYDAIYDSWKDQKSFITFANGVFLVSEVAGIEWDV
jgi:hypothetical protein